MFKLRNAFRHLTRLTCSLLILTIPFQFTPAYAVSSTAGTTVKTKVATLGTTAATATLGKTAKQTQVTVWVAGGSAKQAAVSTVASSSCWQIGKALGATWLMADVDDAYLTKKDRNVKVTVSYYDASLGVFTLQYNSTSGMEKQAEVVYLNGDKEWKTYTFTLNDAAFQDGMDGADLRLSVTVPSLSLTSPVNLPVRSLSVDKLTSSGLTSATLKLGTNATFTNVSAVMRGSNSYQTPVKSTNGWTLSPSQDRLFLVMDVPESLLAESDRGVNVTVEYLDKGSGMFALQYNSSDVSVSYSGTKPGNIYTQGEKQKLKMTLARNSAKQTDPVKLTNTGKWKTATFKLRDAAFSGAVLSTDLWLTAYIPSLGKTSTGDVTVRTVTLTKVSGSSGSQDYSLRYSLLDEEGDAVLKDSQTLTLHGSEKASASLLVAQKDNGLYTLAVSVQNSGSTVKEFAVPMSVIPDTAEDTVNDIFGVSTHFGHSWTGGQSEEKTAIAAKAGIGWIRDDLNWDQAETTKGKIVIPDAWDTFVDDALDNGVQVLGILDFGNQFYDEGGAPYTDEGRAAFVKYATTVAKHFKGRITHFEVWNEYNLEGTWFNPTSRPAEDYAKLLKEVYLALKAVDPDITVIGGSMAGSDFDWLEEILEAGAADYMDAVSLHPYCQPRAPEYGYGYVSARALKVQSMVAQYGHADMPVWVTEIGWPSSGTNGVGAETAGDYLIRTYVEGIANGVDKIFWYDLQDDGVDEDEDEYNFGLIRNWKDPELPMAAKSGYLAYSVLTSQLAGARFVADESKGTTKAYRFSDQSTGDEIVVAWKVDGKGSLAVAASGSVVCYDGNGNKTAVSASGGKATLTVGQSPVFLHIR